MWEEHTHSDGCFLELVCKTPEGHIHSGGCFSSPVLICGLEELFGALGEPGDVSDSEYGDEPRYDPDPEYGNEPGAGHLHTEMCYSESAIICGIEEMHFHSVVVGCYIVHSEQVCGLREHTHDWECIMPMFMPFAIGDRWDLANFVTAVEIKDENGQPIPPGGTIKIGGTYSLGLSFRERPAFQFGYSGFDDVSNNVKRGYLHYPFPSGILVDDAPLTIINGVRNPATGLLSEIGEYYIENNVAYVKFYNVWADGTAAGGNFIDVYTNAEFSIVVSAEFYESGGGGLFNLGNNVSILFDIAKGEAEIEKESSAYNPEDRTIDYTLTITAADGEADVFMVTDLARRAVHLDALWDSSGLMYAGGNPDIRNITVTGPDGLLIELIDYTLGLTPGNNQQLEIRFVNPVTLTDDDKITVTYQLYMTGAITRLYNDPLSEYTFSVLNRATVHYNTNMTAHDESTVRIDHSILHKTGYLIPNPNGPDPRVRWTVTVGDGNARLNELADRTVRDMLGGGVMMPNPLTANVVFYGRTGTYPYYTMGTTAIGYDNNASLRAVYSGGTPVGFEYDIPTSPAGIYYAVMTFDTNIDTSVSVLRWQNTVLFHDVRKVASIATTPGIRIEEWIEIICTEKVKVTSEFYLGPGKKDSVIYLSHKMSLLAPREYSSASSYVYLPDHGASNFKLERVWIGADAGGQGGRPDNGEHFKLYNPPAFITRPVTGNGEAPSAGHNVNLHVEKTNMEVLFGYPGGDPNNASRVMGRILNYMGWPTNESVTLRITYEVPLTAALVNAAGTAVGGTLGSALRDGYKVESKTELYEFNKGSGYFHTLLSANATIGWPVSKSHVGTRVGEGGRVYFDYEVIWDGVRMRGYAPHDIGPFAARWDTLNYTMQTPERFGPGASAIFADTFDSRLSYVPGSFSVTERFIEFLEPDPKAAWGTPGGDVMQAWLNVPGNREFAEANWTTNTPNFWYSYDIPGKYKALADDHAKYRPLGDPALDRFIYDQELYWSDFYKGWILFRPTSTGGGSYSGMRPADWNGIKWKPVAANPVLSVSSGNTLSGPLNLPANAGRNGPLKFSYTLMLETYPTDKVTMLNTASVRVGETLRAGYGDVPVISTGTAAYCAFDDSDLVVYGDKLVRKGHNVTANRAHFEIIINPDGAVLIPAAENSLSTALPATDNLLVEDRMGKDLAFFYDTLRVFLPQKNPDGSIKKEGGEIVWMAGSGTPILHSPVFNPNALFTYTRSHAAGFNAEIDENGDEKNGIVMVLPNGTPLKLTYDARMQGAVHDDALVDNTVEISGITQAEVFHLENIRSLESWGAGNLNQLNLFKVDAEKPSTKIAGAEFALYIGWKGGWYEGGAYRPYGIYPGDPDPIPEPPAGSDLPATFTTDDEGWKFYFLEYGKPTDGTGMTIFDSEWLVTEDHANMVFAMVEVKAPPGYVPAIAVAETNPSLDSVVFFAHSPHADVEGKPVRSVAYDIEIPNEPLKTKTAVALEGRKEVLGRVPLTFDRDFTFNLVEVTADLRSLHPPRTMTAPVVWLDSDQHEGTFRFEIESGIGPGEYYFLITENWNGSPGWLFNEQAFIAKVTVRGDPYDELELVYDVVYFIVDHTVDDSWDVVKNSVAEPVFVNEADVPAVPIVLPQTGGTGIRGYIISGLLLIMTAVLFKINRSFRKRKFFGGEVSHVQIE
jgi:LPXTG-motif cell wall-anchored protein